MLNSKLNCSLARPKGSFVDLVAFLAPCPQSRRKLILHTVRSSASSLNYKYQVFYKRSSSSCLRLLLPLPVTSILPYILPSVSLVRRQFLRKLFPILLAFLLFAVYRIFLDSVTLLFSTRSHSGPECVKACPKVKIQVSV